MPAATPRLRAAILGALGTVAVLTLSACGGAGETGSAGTAGAGAVGAKTGAKTDPFGDLSGPEIAKKALAANLAATSMTVYSDSRDGADHTVQTMAMNRDGDCAGTQTINDEGTLTLTTVGSTTYQKLDEKSVREQYKDQSTTDADNAVSVLADKWTKDTPAEAKENADVCDLHALLTSLQGVGSVSTKGALTTVGGQQAITLTENDSDGTAILYVATKGEPYLLKYVEKTKTPTTTSFSGFNEAVPAHVPAAKDMVDESKLAD